MIGVVVNGVVVGRSVLEVIVVIVLVVEVLAIVVVLIIGGGSVVLLNCSIGATVLCVNCSELLGLIEVLGAAEEE